MHSCIDLGMVIKVVIVLHEFLSSFLVEATFWEWDNEETLNHLENVRKRPLSRVPIFLEGVYANLS